MIKKNLFFALSFIFSVFFSQDRKQPVDLKITSDFTHPATKIIFPMLWSGFQRQAIYSYDMKNRHISVSYVQQLSKKSKSLVTIYLYPKNSIDNQLLRDEFYTYNYALNQNSKDYVKLKPSFGSLSNENVRVNYIYSIFQNSMGERDFFKGVKYVDKNSLLSIYECGGWTFKIRATSDEMSNDQLKELKDKVENYFGVLNVASIKTLPIENVPDIVLSSSVKRDSMMMHSTTEAAKAKIVWLGKNLEKKEILTGFSDMKIDSEVYAAEKMLEYFKAHEKEWPLNDDTKKYFADMTVIAENGKLKDYIYDKYKGLIDYPEGETQQESYARFKADHNISKSFNEILYKIFYVLE